MDPSSPWWRLTGVRPDRAAKRRSLAQVLALPYARVASAHEGPLDAAAWAAAVRAEWGWL